MMKTDEGLSKKQRGFAKLQEEKRSEKVSLFNKYKEKVRRVYEED